MQQDLIRARSTLNLFCPVVIYTNITRAGNALCAGPARNSFIQHFLALLTYIEPTTGSSLGSTNHPLASCPENDCTPEPLRS